MWPGADDGESHGLSDEVPDEVSDQQPDQLSHQDSHKISNRFSDRESHKASHEVSITQPDIEADNQPLQKPDCHTDGLAYDCGTDRISNAVANRHTFDFNSANGQPQQ